MNSMPDGEELCNKNSEKNHPSLREAKIAWGQKEDYDWDEKHEQHSFPDCSSVADRRSGFRLGQYEEQADMNPLAPRLTIITQASQLEALRPAWSDLLARSGSNEPMLSPLWLLTWWRIYGENTGRQLCVGLFHDGARLVGLVPLCRRRHWYGRCIPFRRLEFLGSDVAEEDGVCSEYLNILAERGLEEAVAREFAASLARKAFGPWDELILAALDGDNPMPALLGDAGTRAGLTASRQTIAEAPCISLPASWDVYLAGRNKDQRKFIKQSLRDFDAWAGTDWQLHSATTAAELAEGMRILASLHTERWSAENQGGAFQSPRFTAFHNAVAPQLFQEKAAELLWLSVRGEPIAAVYNFIWQNKIYFYQIGRKLDVADKIRPGIVILVHVVRRFIEAGGREVDFLAGVSQYKMKFATNKRPIVQLRLARSSLVEILRRLAVQGVTWMRTLRGAGRSVMGWDKSKPGLC